VSFAAITIRVASQRVFIIVIVYFVIYSVRKLLDTPSYSTYFNAFVRADYENSTANVPSSAIFFEELNL
jgi:hypothetical protein